MRPKYAEQQNEKKIALCFEGTDGEHQLSLVLDIEDAWSLMKMIQEELRGGPK